MARIMGVVNVTPDSFSDGGLYLDSGVAVAHGLELIEAGADIVDVGGESTRPGAEAVDAEVELKRTRPVVAPLAAAAAEVSIDTSKREVAAAALDEGAGIVNDISALRADRWIALLPLRWVVGFYGANLLLPIGMSAAAGLSGATDAANAGMPVAAMAIARPVVHKPDRSFLITVSFMALAP